MEVHRSRENGLSTVWAGTAGSDEGKAKEG